MKVYILGDKLIVEGDTLNDGIKGRFLAIQGANGVVSYQDNDAEYGKAAYTVVSTIMHGAAMRVLYTNEEMTATPESTEASITDVIDALVHDTPVPVYIYSDRYLVRLQFDTVSVKIQDWDIQQEKPFDYIWKAGAPTYNQVEQFADLVFKVVAEVRAVLEDIPVKDLADFGGDHEVIRVLYDAQILRAYVQ